MVARLGGFGKLLAHPRGPAGATGSLVGACRDPVVVELRPSLMRDDQGGLTPDPHR